MAGIVNRTAAVNLEKALTLHREPEQRTPRRRALVVDDDDESRRALDLMLRAIGFETEVARDGVEALAKIKLDIDLVLLDVRMPNVDGFEVANRLREDPALLHVPIIMVTGLSGDQDRLHSIEVGANDFLTKPVELAELKVRTEWLLRLKDSHDESIQRITALEGLVERRTADLRDALDDVAVAQRSVLAAYLDTIRRLVLAAETKDSGIAPHVERISRYCEAVAERMGYAPSCAKLIGQASLMHDVGKIGIPDYILLKPGPLTDAERAIMERHTIIGARILHGPASEVLRLAEVIALSHHERWDGAGYPQGLQGSAIPIAARICAVADVFDALTSYRPYRDAQANDDTFMLLEEQRGRQFDPEVLDAFTACRAAVERIQHEWGSRQALKPRVFSAPLDFSPTPALSAPGQCPEPAGSLKPKQTNAPILDRRENTHTPGKLP